MSPLLVIVSIVLVDLLGFSLVMPLLPRYAELYGFDERMIGALLAAFPLCQLVAGPVLGRLSDRYGRRPILLISQVGTTASFLMIGLSDSFVLMLLGRMLDGFSGGNILVAQAYIADVTKPEGRSRGLGLIGAAFGVGFVLGPLLGGVLVSLPIGPTWQLRLPFLVAAGFSTAAWILTIFWLPESRPPGERGGPDASRAAARAPSWLGVFRALGDRRAGPLVLLGALLVLSFASLEGTFSLFLERRMGWSAGIAAYWFAGLGLVSALMQGGLIRRLVPRFGEARLIPAGLLLLAGGLAALAVSDEVAGLAAAVLLVGLGQGMAAPTISGLLSRGVPPDRQGRIFGALLSAQTLARLVNYQASNELLGRLGPAAPYWLGAAIGGLALALCPWAIRASGKPADPPDEFPRAAVPAEEPAARDA
ncbi:MFS transporter [Tautonia plasticadhaerens]|uniref:Tetracycline resistance protein, class B n=1 Tax=Tautonia plasticadhaerens TaxID=2527974 RepID=A0A518H2V7_9BACT|nr:MFS transporter [Tautonia plasticadhaerens]QDV35167.1 Tetracycline resistance protein, class B [Tautonia plasticadhaerens]